MSWNLCSATNSRPGRIFDPAGFTPSFAPVVEPIGDGMAPQNWKAITLPAEHRPGDNNHIIQTPRFEITGLELGERAALRNEIKRFGLEQFAGANKFFGGNLCRGN